MTTNTWHTYARSPPLDGAHAIEAPAPISVDIHTVQARTCRCKVLPTRLLVSSERMRRPGMERKGTLVGLDHHQQRLLQCRLGVDELRLSSGHALGGERGNLSSRRVRARMIRPIGWA
eukprot:13179847-Alexandrium_andersonii.AAC.1